MKKPLILQQEIYPDYFLPLPPGLFVYLIWQAGNGITHSLFQFPSFGGVAGAARRGGAECAIQLITNDVLNRLDDVILALRNHHALLMAMTTPPVGHPSREGNFRKGSNA